MLRASLTVAWIIGLIYSTIPVFWLAVHPFADKWSMRRGNIYPILGLFWLLAIILLGVVTAPWRYETLYSTPWSLLPGGFLFALDLYFLRKIGKSFGRDRLIGKNELHPAQHEQTLVTTGMHARMRHPIYLAHLIMLTAWTIGSGLIVMFALWAFAIVTGAFMIRMEDAELERRFGDQYREYRKRVPAIGIL